MSEHDDRREWTLIGGLKKDGPILGLVDGPSLEFGERVDVREVRPGEITLTRDELQKYFETRTTFAKRTVDEILAELFPEGEK